MCQLAIVEVIEFGPYRSRRRNMSSSLNTLQRASLARMQKYMSKSPVPSISAELLATADGAGLSMLAA